MSASRLPARLEIRQLLERGLALDLQFRQPLACVAGHLLSFERCRFEVEARQAPARILERTRHGVLSDRESPRRRCPGRSPPCGQLTPAQIPIRQTDRLLDRFVEDADLMVLFELGREVAIITTAWSADGSSTFTTWIDAPARRPSRSTLVFRPRRRSDGPKLAGRAPASAVRGVVLAGLAAGADHRMRLIDEQNDRLR